MYHKKDASKNIPSRGEKNKKRVRSTSECPSQIGGIRKYFNEGVQVKLGEEEQVIFEKRVGSSSEGPSQKEGIERYTMKRVHVKMIEKKIFTHHLGYHLKIEVLENHIINLQHMLGKCKVNHQGSTDQAEQENVHHRRDHLEKGSIRKEK